MNFEDGRWPQAKEWGQPLEAATDKETYSPLEPQVQGGSDLQNW